jgi:hypothetical protein
VNTRSRSEVEQRGRQETNRSIQFWSRVRLVCEGSISKIRRRKGDAGRRHGRTCLGRHHSKSLCKSRRKGSDFPREQLLRLFTHSFATHQICRETRVSTARECVQWGRNVQSQPPLSLLPPDRCWRSIRAPSRGVALVVKASSGKQEASGGRGEEETEESSETLTANEGGAPPCFRARLRLAEVRFGGEEEVESLPTLNERCLSPLPSSDDTAAAPEDPWHRSGML